MKPDQERIRSLLVDTISLLCRNGLNFENELRVQAVIGVSIDKEECFLVHVNKCFERADEDNCETEEQLKESLQQLASETGSKQPTRDAPPTPVEESQHSIKDSDKNSQQSVSTSRHETNTSTSKQQQQVSASSLSRDNCTSTTDLRGSKSGLPKQEAFDDCAEFNGSKTHGKISKRSMPVESDECDDSSEVTTDSCQPNIKKSSKQHADMEQQYNRTQPTSRKHRHGVDAYRPKPKRQNLCEDLFDVEDDFCSDFTAGQQYMYIDAGRSRARPKLPKQQRQDMMFNPHCTASMMGYGTQDVRPLSELAVKIVVSTSLLHMIH